MSSVDAARRLWVARRLAAHPVVLAAFSTGEISSDHVRGILNTVLKLPAAEQDNAEAELVEAARWVDPVGLGRFCQGVRSRLLLDEDAEALSERRYASRWATASSTFEGMVNVQAMLDPEAGAILLTALAALSGKAGLEDDRTLGQRRADALTELAQHSLDRGELPEHGGDRPQVTVTLDYNTLKAQIEGAREAATAAGQASIGGTVPISPEIVRRLACDAEIIPAVLGGQSEVLDLGRSQRGWSKAQRRAARLRDKGCVFPRCQAGLDRCQLHHIEHWAQHRGPTDLENSAHLCHYHHRLIHHSDWQISRNRDGTIETWRNEAATLAA